MCIRDRGSLPVNWAGVIFIVLAFILFIVEVQVVGFGILGIGAILAFLLGSFLLLMGFLDNSVWGTIGSQYYSYRCSFACDLWSNWVLCVHSSEID